jgi:Tol biopolymer transport system component
MTGGTLSESGGATVVFPAGAVSTDTTFRIAVDSTGAPPLPASLTTAGSMYVITPHGGDFTQPVEVSIPVPNVTLLPTQQLKLAKAQPNGQWELLGDSGIVDGKLKASVDSFSFFTGVIINYSLPILQIAPISFDSTLDCGGQNCGSVVGPVTATYSVTHNGGQLPQGCENPTMETSEFFGGPASITSRSLGNFTVTRVIPPSDRQYAAFITDLRCPEYTSVYTRKSLYWSMGPGYPNLSIVRIPAQLDVVEGLQANLEVMMGGGAARRGGPGMSLNAIPSATDRAVIDWQRSDDAGASWRQIARSFQDEANPLPFGTGLRWTPWQVRHGFIPVATDQGALMRVHACYAPPGSTAAPVCITSAATRLNVLQHSALPAIAEQPRSVLVRSAETANFSVTVSGQPAPALQWQMRPANSTGDWSDVGVGTGATTANYTTPPHVPTDNGVQYRVVATNALGSAASIPVTVSVSDLDVAPSFTTQPASLSVATGGDAVFAAVVHGTEALSYQWRFNGVNIDGANSAILRLTGVTDANAGNYSLFVSNSAGNAASNAATLQVTAGTPASVAPSIVTQPASVVANVGNTATFAVGVDGTGPLSFQWRRDGASIPGANSASLTFNSVALPNAGTYSVMVSNSAGAVVSSNVTLDVHPAVGVISPSITSQPSTVIVPSGGSAMLAVGATGSGPLSYQWIFNGTAIPGATLPVLTLNNVGNANVGNYMVTVANSVSSTASQTVELILLGAPVITQDPVATTAIQGNSARFSVSATGSGLRYQWLRNGNQIPGATEATYDTPSLVEANSGTVYSVMVYNGAGLVTSQGAVLTVQVIIAPSVLQHPANLTIEPGQFARLCTSMDGTRPIHLELRRWVNSQWSVVLISGLGVGENEACFNTPVLQLADDGAQFRYFGSNAAGQVMTNIATITVMAPPPVGITDLTLASPAAAGGPSNHNAGNPSISADGRYVAFTSFATNLIAGFPQGPVGSERNHAFLRDFVTGTTTLINATTSGGVSTHDVENLRLSANGRYALFSSLAGDLVADDTNGSMDVFRRDLQTGTTVRANLLPNGDQLEGGGNATGDLRLTISGDGRFVTFISTTDMSTGGSGGSNDGYFLYVRDMQTGFTRYVAATQGPTQLMYAAMADNGEWLAYEQYHGPTDTVTIVLYDIEAHEYHEPYSYVQGTFPAGSRPGLSVSADGRYVAFAMNVPSITGSTNDQVMLVDGDNPGIATVVSTGANGPGDGASSYPRISADGRYVMFETIAPNLTGGEALPWRRFNVIRDRVAGVTTFATHRANGTPVWAAGNGTSVISSDASTVAFVADYNEVIGGTQVTQIFAEPRQ